MAILKQLSNFVEQLFESGMIDETEMEQLQAPIDKKTRQLEAQGPSWKIPVISEVIYQIEQSPRDEEPQDMPSNHMTKAHK